MKIIDLLNKIANGEIDRNNRYQFSRDDYCTINDFFARYIVDEENLNLEIIEEDKKIEKLDVIAYDKCIHEVTHKEKELALEIRKTQIVLNELIDEVNKLKEGKE